MYAKRNVAAKAFFVKMLKTCLQDRTARGVLTAPLSARVVDRYMVDNRVGSHVRLALRSMQQDC